VNSKCKSLYQKAQAVVSKLALGVFSLKADPKGPHLTS
jgi:hypothetical protein